MAAPKNTNGKPGGNGKTAQPGQPQPGQTPPGGQPEPNMMPLVTSGRMPAGVNDPAMAQTAPLPKERIMDRPAMNSTQWYGEQFMDSVVTPWRVWLHRIARFSPIRGLTPEKLAQQLDEWNAGFIRYFALTMDAISRRDDILVSVIQKRTDSIVRLNWEIVISPDAVKTSKATEEEEPEDGSETEGFNEAPADIGNSPETAGADRGQMEGEDPLSEENDQAEPGSEEPPKQEVDPEAQAHHDALKYFYENMRCTSAIDHNMMRGFSLLVEQMMDAVGKKYSVHEVIWQPQADGKITATFNWVPLWFFENRTGRLRFLEHEWAIEGCPLKEGGWMTTVGAGLMEACSVAYMFKHLPLKDWVLYCEKHGMPGIVGKTNFPVDSPGWENMMDAVKAVAQDFAVVTNKEDEIDKIDFAADGQLPYPILVDRMDRAMASIWRGADLSTKSAGVQTEGTGASLQSDEMTLLEEKDAKLLSETLNEQIDKRVIAYVFGEGVKPKAYIRIVPPRKQNIDADIKIDDFLIKNGAPLGLTDTMERYGRDMPEPDDEVLSGPPEPQMPPGMGGMPGMPGAENDQGGDQNPMVSRYAANEDALAANRELVFNAVSQFRGATLVALRPIIDRLEAIAEMPNEETFYAAVRKLRDDLPELAEEINRDPANAQALEQAMAAGLLNGFVEGAVRQ